MARNRKMTVAESMWVGAKWSCCKVLPGLLFALYIYMVADPGAMPFRAVFEKSWWGYTTGVWFPSIYPTTTYAVVFVNYYTIMLACLAIGTLGVMDSTIVRLIDLLIMVGTPFSILVSRTISKLIFLPSMMQYETKLLEWQDDYTKLEEEIAQLKEDCARLRGEKIDERDVRTVAMENLRKAAAETELALRSTINQLEAKISRMEEAASVRPEVGGNPQVVDPSSAIATNGKLEIKNVQVEPESIKPGGKFHPGAGPKYQGSVWAFDGEDWERIGEFVRIDDYLATFKHLFSGETHEAYQLRGPTGSIDLTDLNELEYTEIPEGDGIVAPLSQIEWSTLGLKRATLDKPGNPLGRVTVAANGKCSRGSLRPCVNFPKMGFNGSTECGFSGAAFTSHGGALVALHQGDIKGTDYNMAIHHLPFSSLVEKLTKESAPAELEMLEDYQVSYESAEYDAWDRAAAIARKRAGTRTYIDAMGNSYDISSGGAMKKSVAKANLAGRDAAWEFHKMSHAGDFDPSMGIIEVDFEALLKKNGLLEEPKNGVAPEARRPKKKSPPSRPVRLNEMAIVLQSIADLKNSMAVLLANTSSSTVAGDPSTDSSNHPDPSRS